MRQNGKYLIIYTNEGNITEYDLIRQYKYRRKSQ